jgi:hypothetical protein
LLRAYTYLRDAKRDGFTDMKLMGTITQKLQEITRTLHDQGGSARLKLKDWACTHCHSEIHEGGEGSCPLKELKAKPARRIARDAAKRIKDEPDVINRMIQEEKDREKEKEKT